MVRFMMDEHGFTPDKMNALSSELKALEEAEGREAGLAHFLGFESAEESPKEDSPPPEYPEGAVFFGN